MSASGQAVHVELLHIERSRVYVPPQNVHRLAIHVGPSVNADCACDGKRHRRVQRDGDFDVIPAGLDGTWEDDRSCTILRIMLPDDLVRRTADDLGVQNHALRPHFQRRDAGILSIARAMRCEVETVPVPDRHYLDALGRAIAIRLVKLDGESRPERARHRLLSTRQRMLLADFIEANLGDAISLAQLAGLVAMSLSTFKMAFRQSFGMAPYQYLLARRVERARTLVSASTLTFAEIAIASGFSHQSHMTNSMKRHLGHSPGAIVRNHA